MEQATRSIEFPKTAWELLEKGSGYNLFTALSAVYGCSEPKVYGDVKPLALASGKAHASLMARFGITSPVIDFAESAPLHEQISLAKYLNI